MSKDFNMAEARALMDKMAMEDPEGFVRAVAGGKTEKESAEYYAQIERAQGGGPMLSMSLRDYFAAAAATGFASNQEWMRHASDRTGKQADECVAIGAYEIADAMLLERAK